MCYPPQDYVGTIPGLHAPTHGVAGVDPVALDTSQTTTGRFGMPRMPDGVLGNVLTAQGVGVDPIYAPAGGADTRGRTIVVAASNSIDPTLAPAAYRCDGVADQVEINAAIAAMGATGGTVILLEGTYNITASINLASLTALMGQGAGTVLFIPNGHNADLNVISAVSVNRVLVADLRIDGNKANQTAGNMNGIYFETVTYSKIVDSWVENLRTLGIYLEASDYNTIVNNISRGNSYGIYGYQSSSNIVVGNTFGGNGSRGIYWEGSTIPLGPADYNAFIGNTCRGNTGDGFYLYNSKYNTIAGNTIVSNGSEGIYLDEDCSDNDITGNIIKGNSTDGIECYTAERNTISGNILQGNGAMGIYLYSSDYNAVVGNTIKDNTWYGIWTEGCNYNTISGNTVSGNNYTGIHLYESGHSTVESNTVVGNSQGADNTYDGITIEANSDYNNVQGNTVRHAGGAKQHRYGINIASAGCDGTLVINNDLYLAGKTADYNDAGTGTIYHNNRTTAGWVA